MNGEAYYQLGMALHHANRPDEVKAVAEKLVSFEPKRAKKLLQRVSQVIKQDFGFQDVQAILKEVTNDEALELYVISQWGSGEQDQLEWYIANELNSRALENRPL